MKTPAEILAEDRLWRVTDVARYLGMSESWIYHAVERGELPARRIGNRLRFEPEAIKRYVQRENTGSNVVPIGAKV